MIIILLITCAGVATQAYPRVLPGYAMIDLQHQWVNIEPKEFYMAGFEDARKGDHAIGKLAGRGAGAASQPINQNIELRGGVDALGVFMVNSLIADRSLRPVNVKLTDLKIIETGLAGGRVSGQIIFAVVFELKKDDRVIYLTDYTGKANYQRAAGPAQQIEPLLRNTISNSLAYFNNWINEHVDKNIVLANGVKVIFSNYDEPIEGDTIYYRTNRPLKWTDFQQTPRLTGNYGAEIFTSLGYNEKTELVNGMVNVKIDLKVYAPKSACWAREEAKNAYGLNHEQRHFDIVRLIAEHFKQTINAERLTPDNFDGIINVAYFEALREMDRIQKLYDSETNHSVNTYQQQVWNNKIDNELQQLGIKTTEVLSSIR